MPSTGLVKPPNIHNPFLCADKSLDLSVPRIMGILNITPDSFADGGQYNSLTLALKRARTIIEEGADIIDIGGESSRPDASVISDQEELDRIMPVICAIKSEFDVLISVDTYKPVVMREVIKAGVHIINDIKALQTKDALETVAESTVGVCLMHMQGTPQTMQRNPEYEDVLQVVKTFLERRVKACINAGIARERIVIDPGFGFGKSLPHNLMLLKNLRELASLNRPLLVGLSRKASIGEILNLPVSERLYGSIAAHMIAIFQGASIIRTHDIKPTVEALKVTHTVLSG